MPWVEQAARSLEFVGVAVIILGGAAATIVFAGDLLAKTGFDTAYGRYRAHFGRAILLGLEFLVAGDIIATILVDQTLESVGVLAIVVLVRTFLSFSLETEIEGRPPWRGDRAVGHEGG